MSHFWTKPGRQHDPSEELIDQQAVARTATDQDRLIFTCGSQLHHLVLAAEFRCEECLLYEELPHWQALLIMRTAVLVYAEESRGLSYLLQDVSPENILQYGASVDGMYIDMMGILKYFLISRRTSPRYMGT